MPNDYSREKKRKLRSIAGQLELLKNILCTVPKSKSTFKRNLDLKWEFCFPIKLVSKRLLPKLNAGRNNYLGLFNAPDQETYLCMENIF